MKKIQNILILAVSKRKCLNSADPKGARNGIVGRNYCLLTKMIRQRKQPAAHCNSTLQFLY